MHVIEDGAISAWSYAFRLSCFLCQRQSARGNTSGHVFSFQKSKKKQQKGMPVSDSVSHGTILIFILFWVVFITLPVC